MKRNHFKIYALTFLSALGISSCTDLELEGTDSIISETGNGGFTGVSNVATAIDNIYNRMNNIGEQNRVYALWTVSTDELLIPTRGTDWGDNGVWRVLHNHTWNAGHEDVLRAWNDWNQNAFLANEIIDARSNPSTEQAAEAKFLRAFSTWILLDLYGKVPFRAPDEGPEVNPRVLSRVEALDLVISDLNDAITGLPSVPGGSGDANRTASKAAARHLLAKVLLNAHIYRGDAVNTSDMTQVIALVDAITAEGYALESGYFDIFKQDADNETIWWLQAGIGNRIWNGMHYNMVAPDQINGGWNGFSTLAEFYDLFEGDPNSNYVGSGQEERRGWVPDNTNAGPDNLGIGYGFLIGQQYSVNGTPLTDRPGNPLVFTKEFPALIGNNERTGIRTIKYHPVNGSFTGHQIIFRYADAHLMKAEALFRSGGDGLALVNQLRVIRNATPLGTLTEQNLLDERGRELYVEFWRRNDLIRFGQFTRDWEFKDPASVGDETKNLFPIPSNALLSNPNLEQNPGY